MIDRVDTDSLHCVLDFLSAKHINVIAKTCRRLRIHAHANASGRGKFSVLKKKRTAPPIALRRVFVDSEKLFHLVPRATATHVTLDRAFVACPGLDTWPVNLTHLCFGDTFNEPVEGCLPESVTHLRFGDDFNQPITTFPQSLIKLRFGLAWSQTYQYFPQTLRILSFHPCNKHCDSLSNLPRRLQKLRLPVTVARSGVLPPALKELYGYLPTDNVAPFPTSLSVLCMSVQSTIQYQTFPSTLTYLDMGTMQQPPLGCFFPASLTHLKVNGDFNNMDALRHCNSLTHFTAVLKTKLLDFMRLPPSVYHLMMVVAVAEFDASGLVALPSTVSHVVLAWPYAYEADWMSSGITDLSTTQVSTLIVDEWCARIQPPTTLREYYSLSRVPTVLGAELKVLGVPADYRRPFDVPRNCEIVTFWLHTIDSFHAGTEWHTNNPYRMRREYVDDHGMERTLYLPPITG